MESYAGCTIRLKKKIKQSKTKDQGEDHFIKYATTFCGRKQVICIYTYGHLHEDPGRIHKKQVDGRG